MLTFIIIILILMAICRPRRYRGFGPHHHHGPLFGPPPMGGPRGPHGPMGMGGPGGPHGPMGGDPFGHGPGRGGHRGHGGPFGPGRW